jgi:hypothetical protein
MEIETSCKNISTNSRKNNKLLLDIHQGPIRCCLMNKKRDQKISCYSPFNEMVTASAQCVVQSMVDLTKTHVPSPKLALSGPGTVLPVRRAAKTKSANSRFFFFRARRFCFFRNKMLRICGIY